MGFKIYNYKITFGSTKTESEMGMICFDKEERVGQKKGERDQGPNKMNIGILFVQVQFGAIEKEKTVALLLVMKDEDACSIIHQLSFSRNHNK